MDDVLANKHALVAQGSGVRALSGAAGWLHLLAAPTFVIMALVTGMSSDRATAMLCGQETSPLGGMAAMYVLMSVFHVAPWLRLLSRRRMVAAKD